MVRTIQLDGMLDKGWTYILVTIISTSIHVDEKYIGGSHYDVLSYTINTLPDTLPDYIVRTILLVRTIRLDGMIDREGTYVLVTTVKLSFKGIIQFIHACTYIYV